MTRTCDIAIIGGGIVGNAIARELSRYEFDILLIEKETEIRDTTQINFLAYLGKLNQKPVISKEHQLAKWFSKKEIELLQNVSMEVKGISLSILT